MALFFFWVIFLAVLTVRKWTSSIIYTPVIVVLLPISCQFVSFSQVENRGITLSSYLVMIWLTALSMIRVAKHGNTSIRVTKLIAIFTLLLIFLALFNSSEIWESFKRSLPIIASFWVLLGMSSFKNNFNHSIVVNRQIFYSLTLFTTNVLIISVLSLGDQFMEKSIGITYSASFLRGGWFTIFSLHWAAIITSLIPFFIESKFNKNFGKTVWIILFFAASFILIFAYKRIYYIILFTGILNYIIYRFSNNRRKLLSYIAFYFIAISFIFVSYFIFLEYLEIRNKTLSFEEFQNEGRYMEFALYPEVVSERNLLFFLFGDELFVSGGKFEALDQIEIGRFLHNDFAHLLYGAGIVGVSIYLLIFWNIYSEGKQLLSEYRTQKHRFFYFLINTIIITSIISGFSDGILILINRVIPFYLIGVSLGFMKSKIT